jgi:hypothetical protein
VIRRWYNWEYVARKVAEARRDERERIRSAAPTTWWCYRHKRQALFCPFGEEHDAGPVALVAIEGSEE